MQKKYLNALFYLVFLVTTRKYLPFDLICFYDISREPHQQSPHFQSPHIKKVLLFFTNHEYAFALV